MIHNTIEKRVNIDLLITGFLSSHNYSKLTRKNYASTLKKYFADVDAVVDVLSVPLSEAINSIKEKAGTDNNKTLNEHFNRIRKFLEWFVHEDKNISDKLQYKIDKLTHAHKSNSNPVIVDDDNLNIILAVTKDIKIKATLLAYLDTGVRKEEITQLYPDAFRNKAQLEIYSSKTGSDRTIYAISERVIELVESEEWDKESDSFSSPYEIEKFLKKLHSQNEIKITFNQLRHTFATNYIEQKGNPYMLANMMGNSVEVILKNYYHNNTKLARQEVDTIVNKRASLKTQEAYIKYLEAKVKELEDGK